VRREPGHRRLVVRNLVSGQRLLPARTRLNRDLGRPSLRDGRLAWHVISRTGSKIFVRTLATRDRRVIASTKIGRLSNPSLNRTRIVWVDARSGGTYLRQGRIGRRGTRVIAKIRRRSASYWTTSISAYATYFTRWTVSTGGAVIVRRPN
jgi:hypothetical protein